MTTAILRWNCIPGFCALFSCKRTSTVPVADMEAQFVELMVARTFHSAKFLDKRGYSRCIRTTTLMGDIAMRHTRRLLSASTLAFLLVVQSLALQAESAQQQTPSAGSASSQRTQQPNSNCTNSGTYTNSKGQTVKRPENCSSVPQGATAQCRDGSYSFSQSHRGTCSHHGGVAKWL